MGSSILGTMVVLAVLILIVGAVIFKLAKDKKAGRSSCGCNCGCCPNSSACHGHRSDFGERS